MFSRTVIASPRAWNETYGECSGSGSHFTPVGMNGSMLCGNHPLARPPEGVTSSTFI
jgi:hypothetical protein